MQQHAAPSAGPSDLGSAPPRLAPGPAGSAPDTAPAAHDSAAPAPDPGAVHDSAAPAQGTDTLAGFAQSGRPQIVPAVPTPFGDDGRLDRAAFEELLAGLDGVVDAVFAAGTTGEFPALGDDERIELFRVAIEVLGPERVIGHVGHHSLGQVFGLVEQSRSIGVRRFAAMSPVFFHVGDSEVLTWFGELAGRLDHAGGEQLYAYLFPERSGSTLTDAALGELLHLPGIAGAKLSGSAAGSVEAARAAAPGAQVYSGDDRLMRGVFDAGGTGVVSGCASAFPEGFGRLADGLAAGDAAAVASAEAEVHATVQRYGRSVLPLKAELARRTGRPWRARMTMAG